MNKGTITGTAGFRAMAATHITGFADVSSIPTPQKKTAKQKVSYITNRWDSANHALSFLSKNGHLVAESKVIIYKTRYGSLGCCSAIDFLTKFHGHTVFVV